MSYTVSKNSKYLGEHDTKASAEAKAFLLSLKHPKALMSVDRVDDTCDKLVTVFGDGIRIKFREGEYVGLDGYLHHDHPWWCV